MPEAELSDRYIVGYEIDGKVRPIGWSKDLEYAKEIAKRHKIKIYELKEVKGED
jgi:NDP-sugar pyrophosphorylase family protein